jgi:hypothetical protein
LDSFLFLFDLPFCCCEEEEEEERIFPHFFESFERCPFFSSFFLFASSIFELLGGGSQLQIRL